ncbi:MAG: N-terminal phage integrase SAM-like domain-containing protein [Gaiellales bacterium]
MPSEYVRTATPGIYRRGNKYIIKQRDRTGRMHARSASTMNEAKNIQSTLRADAAHGTLVVETRQTFDAYARDWITTYAGRTSRGFRSSTREEYERSLRLHAIPFFGRMRLSDITPPDIKAYITSCMVKGLGRHGVKNALCPVKALLATAFEDGLIRGNPAANVRVVLHQEILGEPTADDVRVTAMLNSVTTDAEHRVRVSERSDAGVSVYRAGCSASFRFAAFLRIDSPCRSSR